MPHGPWTKNLLYQLTLIGVCDTAQIVNVHHYEASNASDGLLTNDAARSNSAGLLADDWIANLKTAWLTMHPPEYTLQMVKAQVLEVKGETNRKLSQVERAQTTSNIGLAAAASEVTHVAAVIRWRTPVAGKSSRGRTYVGPLPSNWMSSGVLTAPATTAITAYGTAMRTRYTFAGTPATAYLLTIYSKPYNHQEYGYPTGHNPTRTWYYPPDYDGNSTNVTEFQVDPILRVQRRREVGVGS